MIIELMRNALAWCSEITLRQHGILKDVYTSV